MLQISIDANLQEFEDIKQEISATNEKKQEYIEFCQKEKLPLFIQPWWLEVACKYSNLEWDVILYKKGGHIWGSFIYTFKRIYGFKKITMPYLTPYLGPYIKYPPNQKESKRLSWEKEIMTFFIDSLPNFDDFILDFNPTITNWLPFMWRGFKQTTHYTYILKNLDNLDEVYSNFEPMARNNIKKAQNAGVEVVESQNIDEFFRVNRITFDMQNVKVDYNEEFLKELYYGAKGRVKMLFAKKDNEVLSVVLAFWDEKTLYMLAAGSNRYINTYRAEYLLFWEMIQFASKKGLDFDFEGSILEGIERRNRAFGATQKPYFQITKTPSKLIRLRNYIWDLIRC